MFETTRFTRCHTDSIRAQTIIITHSRELNEQNVCVRQKWTSNCDEYIWTTGLNFILPFHSVNHRIVRISNWKKLKKKQSNNVGYRFVVPSTYLYCRLRFPPLFLNICFGFDRWFRMNQHDETEYPATHTDCPGKPITNLYIFGEKTVNQNRSFWSDKMNNNNKKKNSLLRYFGWVFLFMVRSGPKWMLMWRANCKIITTRIIIINGWLQLKCLCDVIYVRDRLMELAPEHS